MQISGNSIKLSHNQDRIFFLRLQRSLFTSDGKLRAGENVPEQLILIAMLWGFVLAIVEDDRRITWEN
jgi:hypothetical protein